MISNFFWGSWSWWIYYTWNVWIWTTSPTSKLEVNWNIKSSGFCIWTDCKTSWSQVSTSDDIILLDTNISYSATAWASESDPFYHNIVLTDLIYNNCSALDLLDHYCVLLITARTEWLVNDHQHDSISYTVVYYPNTVNRSEVIFKWRWPSVFNIYPTNSSRNSTLHGFSYASYFLDECDVDYQWNACLNSGWAGNNYINIMFKRNVCWANSNYCKTRVTFIKKKWAPPSWL